MGRFRGAAFGNSFMQGFSFVDDIKRSRVRDKQLQTRLDEDRQERAFERSRTQERDAQVRENRGFAAEERQRNADDRQRRLTTEGRAKEANKLLADPNTPLELLQEYADFPEISGEINRRKKNRQRQADAETLYAGQDLEQASADAVPPDAEEQQAGFGPQLQAELPPGDEFGVQTRATNADLNRLALTDPEAAIEQRDLQNADDAVQQGERNAVVGGIVPNKSNRVGETPLQQRNRKNQGKSKVINDKWADYDDINVVSADPLRGATSTQQVADWHKDRGNIKDPDLQASIDRKMQPHIQAVIEEQSDILMRAEPGSREFRNATRKSQQAYGLNLATSNSYSPAQIVGVTKAGVPTNGRKPELQDAIMDSSATGPQPMLPNAPGRQRMDSTVVRGSKAGGRVNRKKLDAAYRMWSDQEISTAAYQTFINTGALPSGVKTELVQHDVKKNLNVVTKDANGNVIGIRTIQYGRDPDNKYGRNAITKDGKAVIDDMAKAYNTDDYKTRGTDAAANFYAIIEQIEGPATQAGYDFSIAQDVGAVFQIYNETVTFREARDAEWRLEGNWNPEFSQDYTGIADAMFSPRRIRETNTGELEDPNTGDTLGRPTPIKGQGVGRNDRFDYDALRADFEQFEGMSNEQIQQIIDQSG